MSAGKKRRARKVIVHTDSEIKGIRRAAAETAGVRERLANIIRPGMTTLEIDEEAARLIAATGGSSAFHGYRGFPGQICISVNDEVVHGIGIADKIIQFGDVVSIDVGIKINGFIGDTATSILVGAPATAEIVELLETTRQCLTAGIKAARSGNRVGDISRAIEKIAVDAGFAVVRDFVGHGCGCELHEPPEVPNFTTKNPGPRLLPGMVLAIEPMVNEGSAKVAVDGDGWTVRTRDGKNSAHFEHMVLITKNEAEILTWPKTP